MKKAFLLLIVLFLSISLIPISKAKAASEPVLKVKLKNYLGNQTLITIKTRGDFLTPDKKVLLKNATEYKLKLEKAKFKLYQGSKLIGQYNSLTVNPSKNSNILYINKRPYSGSFQFIRETVNKKDYIRPINSIKLEEYLKGVVPYEMPALWHKEAVKAQAVAARTYALSHAKTTIDDTINYQVYGGFEGNAISDAAVKETAGQILKYKGKPISAVFSASNGGKTESNSNVWGTDPVSYFAIKKDTFDPKMGWSFQISKKQIDLSGKKLSDYDRWWNTVKEKDTAIISNVKTWLNSNGYYGKDIKVISIPNLAFSAPSSGGRVMKGSVTIEFLVKGLKDSKGNLIPQKIELKNVEAKEVRAIIGIRVVKSYLIDKQENSTNSFKIHGQGDGHGVGLSQWGAKKRADAGQKLMEILSFYYPGTSLVKEYSSGDTKPPIIKDIKAGFDPKTMKVKGSFHINEPTKTTVLIRDKKNKVIKTLANKKSFKTGSKTFIWNVSKVSNGDYSVVIISEDNSRNKASAVLKYKLTKKAPKAKTGK